MQLSGSLISASPDAEIRIWNTDSLECEQIMKTHKVVNSFQSDGNKIISGSGEGIMVWDIKSGKLIRKLADRISRTWMVKFDESRCVAAVQRNGNTWIDVLTFGEDEDEDTGIPRDAKRARL